MTHPTAHTKVPRSAIWRLAAIDRLLRQGERPTARQLAARFEVSKRTVYRDIGYLKDLLGAPVAYDPIDNGYAYTEPGYQLPAMTLTEGELVALFLAERTLREFRGTPYEADIRTAFDKIVSLLPEEVSIHLGGLDSLYSFRPGATSLQDIETFRSLAGAALGGERLRIAYRSAKDDEARKRLIDPYHLANVDGEWYLFAHCHLRDAVRVFRPDRIQSIARTGETFERPADFTPADHLDNALSIFSEGEKVHRVVLVFSDEVARFVREKIWHASQKLTAKKDGGVRLEMKLSSLIEIKRFAMSWGRHCRVERPKRLVDEVKAELEAMLGGYA